MRAQVRADDIFFPAMALLILGIVVTGFGKSYFLAGMMRAKLPNALVHVHGAVFVLWISLVFTQPWLIAAHKVEWHMKLGVLSLVLLPSMLILGILTLFDFIRRAQPEEGPELLLVGDLEILILFVAVDLLGLARTTRCHFSQTVNDPRYDGNYGSGNRSLGPWNSHRPQHYFCVASFCPCLRSLDTQAGSSHHGDRHCLDGRMGFHASPILKAGVLASMCRMDPTYVRHARIDSSRIVCSIGTKLLRPAEWSC